MSPTRDRSADYPTALDLLDLYINTCYVHAQHRCITRVNEWSGGDAPRFWLGRTTIGSIWRWRYDLPLDIRRSLDRLLRREPIAHSFPAPLHSEQDIVSIVSGSHDAPEVVSGPVYWCRVPPAVTVSSVVKISIEQAGLMGAFLEDWVPDIKHEQPMMVSTSEGHAVSVCASVRSSADAAVAGVETAPRYRRRGHAARAVAAWAAAVRSEGKTAFYSTSWENQASRSVAAKLGFEIIGEDFRVS